MTMGWYASVLEGIARICALVIRSWGFILLRDGGRRCASPSSKSFSRAAAARSTKQRRGRGREMNDLESAAAVGERLQRIRLGSGVNQTQFAQTLGLQQNTYSSSENGSRKCSVEAAAEIVRQYRVTLDYIFMGKEAGLTMVRARELSECG